MIYLFCLVILWWIAVAERAFATATSAHLDTLRQSRNASAKRAALLLQQVRSSMSALLLMRLGLQIGFVVFGMTALLSAESIRTAFLSWGGVPMFYEPLLFAAVALGSAFLFWGVRKADEYFRFPPVGVFLLTRLSGFVQVCKWLFYPFLAKEPPVPEAVVAAQQTEATTNGNGMQVSEGKREIELLRSIVKFGDVTVKKIMQARAKIVALDFRWEYGEVLNTVRTSGFSRLPVFDEDLDNITGILYVKDLVAHLNKEAAFEWQSLIHTDVLMVPESKPASELLEEFKEKKLHIAIVIDEYGGTSGIVTLEDILEEVTGEIRDEFDEEQEIGYRKLDRSTYLFEGQTLLEDVCRVTGLPLHTFDGVRANADTLAGLVLELKGDIPKASEDIQWKGFHLTVMAADKRRVKQIRLKLPEVFAPENTSKNPHS